MLYFLTLIVLVAQVAAVPGLSAAEDPASQRLMDLILDPLHLLLVLAPIVILLAVRRVAPEAFTGRLEAWVVFYPAPLTIGGACLGLTTFDGWAARVAIGIVAWGLASLLFKVAKPFLQRVMRRTFGTEVDGGLLG